MSNFFTDAHPRPPGDDCSVHSDAIAVPRACPVPRAVPRPALPPCCPVGGGSAAVFPVLSVLSVFSVSPSPPVPRRGRLSSIQRCHRCPPAALPPLLSRGRRLCRRFRPLRPPRSPRPPRPPRSLRSLRFPPLRARKTREGRCPSREASALMRAATLRQAIFDSSLAGALRNPMPLYFIDLFRVKEK